MSSTSAQHTLFTMKRKYIMLRFGEVLAFSIGVGLIALALLLFFPITWPFRELLAMLVTVATFIVQCRALQIFGVTEKRIVGYLNARYPELEASADLLLENNELNSLQHLQKNRVTENFQAIYSTIQLPHHLVRAGVILIAGIASFLLIASFGRENFSRIQSATNKTTNSHSVETNTLPASISKTNISVTPPAYTGLAEFTAASPALVIPENSTVQWTISFSEPVSASFIVLGGADTIQMISPGNNTYLYTRVFTRTSFYQFLWTNDRGVFSRSDYFTIDVTPDQPPKIVIAELQQFTQLPYDNKQSIDLAATITDDYGLSQATIIATVSKGSGESVKFREEKLSFAAPAIIRGKKVDGHRVLDLKKLGMAPGDELYFYVEAQDTRTPLANTSRTGTYFIALEDTVKENLSVEAGLGVDLMPEYFRSQRQIIIDTEKLLREKKKITREKFNARSNELGYDQKVLRLRYGEFLGEEFESGITKSDEANKADGKPVDVLKDFGHSHDTENEHNLVPDHKKEEKKNGKDEESPLEAFIHSHDNAEEATFFEQSIRAKLKAALTVMWDAELHLRMFTPEKSLPYQYKALKLLKEISNDSRIYVHRTGFDPPPVKEEKRLTGDLTDIKNSRLIDASAGVEKLPAIRQAIPLVVRLLEHRSLTVGTADRSVLQEAGNELSTLALQDPGAYIRSLSQLRKLIDGEIDQSAVIPTLQDLLETLYKCLPKETASPVRSSALQSAWDRSFIKELEAQQNE